MAPPQVASTPVAPGLIPLALEGGDRECAAVCEGEQDVARVVELESDPVGACFFRRLDPLLGDGPLCRRLGLEAMPRGEWLVQPLFVLVVVGEPAELGALALESFHLRWFTYDDQNKQR